MAELNFGIIAAAGRGRRFGGLKQFALVNSKPLLFYSLKAFELCPSLTGYAVVTNPSRISKVKQLLKRFRFQKAIAVVPGGKARMDSIEQGLFALPESGYVAVHDGARPFIHWQMLILGFRAVRQYPAVAFGVPVIDTLKEVFKDRIVRTVDRSGLVAVQTPQFFSLDLLRRAYAQARNQKITATDECQLIENLGISPRWLPGSSLNIKITSPEELLICRALL
ncbi:MAG: 2-C-methyl-D-erythritol 4-phosphate cytidylyltransferase [bacterium]